MTQLVEYDKIKLIKCWKNSFYNDDMWGLNMAFLKCKMCGGDLDIIPGASVASCAYCGTKQTLPKLDDEKRVKLFDRANHFRRANEFDKAMGIYEMILSDSKDDSEAYWGLVLCRYGIAYVEDPKTGRRMPTVNRSQFISVFDDDDYKSAIACCSPEQKAVYEAEAKAIDNIHKMFLRISQDEEPFDVFICYKESDENGQRTQDSVYAYDIYDALTKEGLKVFFARVSLEDKLGSMYEPYIFSALNSAQVMIAIGTKREYFDAVWVKNEWSRFLGLIKAGKNKTLIPVYKDISPYDMPEEFTYLQSLDIGKIGYIQDLVRGVKKIVNFQPVQSPKITVDPGYAKRSQKETVDVEKMIRLSSAALESKKWNEARSYAKKARLASPDRPEPYLYTILADNKLRSTDELKKTKKVVYDNDSYYDIYLKRCRESEQIKINRKLLVKKGKYTRYKLFGVLLGIASTLLLLIGVYYALIFINDNGYVVQELEIKTMLPLFVIAFLSSFYGLFSAKNKARPLHSSISLLLAFISLIASVVCFYKVNTDWGPKKKLEFINELYNEGAYEEAFGWCFDGHQYAYQSFLFEEISIYSENNYENDTEFCKMAFKCATAAAQQYVDQKNYDGLISFLGEKKFFVNKHFHKMKINIPESDYELFIKKASSLSSKWSFGQVYESFGDMDSSFVFYAELQRDLLHKLPEGVADTTMIDEVCSLIAELEDGNYKSNRQRWIEDFKQLFEYKEVQAMYLNDDYICTFMLGKWSNKATYYYDERYIEFYQDEEDGGISVQYRNLPTPDEDAEYYDVQNQVYVWEDSNYKKICDVYKFTFIDADTLECYCYENGSTYTLYRK